MHLKVLPIAVAMIAELAVPAIALGEEPTPAMRAWMKIVSNRLQAEGFRVQTSQIDARGLTFEATFRRRGQMQSVAAPENERSSAESR